MAKGKTGWDHLRTKKVIDWSELLEVLKEMDMMGEFSGKLIGLAFWWMQQEDAKQQERQNEKGT